MTDPGDAQDGTERLAQLITQALIECGDELRRDGATFPTAVALMEEVGRRVAAQVTQDRVYVAEGWWHLSVNNGRVHVHPENPGRGWSSASHRLCEPVYTERTP